MVDITGNKLTKQSLCNWMEKQPRKHALEKLMKGMKELKVKMAKVEKHQKESSSRPSRNFMKFIYTSNFI